MAGLEDLGEVISTDVLIIGGSIGALVSAIKAKESPVDVLVVDKQTVGWSGKVPRGRGGILTLAPGDDVDKLIEFHTKNIGHYLNDQELFRALFRDTYPAVKQLAEWGVWVRRDAEGKMLIRKHRSGLCSMVSTDINLLLPLRARAHKLGVKMLNKVHIVDLLKQGDRVVGAVGFSLIDGRFYILKAKATILANGGCNFRADRWHSSGYGDGIATAYRAGAEIRNAEFGNFYGLRPRDSGGTYMTGGAHLSDENVFNSRGENIFKKYVSGPQPDTAIEFILGLEKEMNEGRGPFYVDMSKAPPPLPLPPKLQELRQRTEAKEAKYGTPPLPMPEVRLALYGELTPVKVDHQMKTSLDGLWAVGDASNEGSAWAGAIFSPRSRLGGTGLMYALVSAWWAGPNAAKYASQSTASRVNYREVNSLKEVIFAPVKRKTGLLPADAVNGIQEVICPIKYNLRRSKNRLEEAISKLDDLKQKLPGLYARDYHGLGKCHEARSMAACAEMILRSALMRTESRGWHYREDYPHRDDKDWLRWVIVKQDSSKMALSTETVPITRYKFKPE